MPIQIRLARPSDVGDIFRVRTSVNENVLSVTEMADMGITEASVTDMIRSAPCAWVACENAQVVGFSMIDSNEGSLFAAFVLPSHEGKGIGKKLVQAAEEVLFSKHALAWLETAETSRAAGFYRHLGWGHERDVGEGDIRLEKRRL
ncbi:GNAT family N-acetyltransferase [Cupriavidus basilensis]|uniref:GNAT family N-acetyltransferase n=1 Tax=Cupriavidus basilensis TaxID=68895 RepID=A0ABT6AYL5_9BURK|nr:GNAT family N-acetyltransferase [Cupriavidus basilensis]MDF3837720.1 GNAT family N-acetyltransferase [Cupriavidus basilensis]